MKQFRRQHRVLAVVAIAASLVLGGCATVQQARGGPGQKLDPWESWNRKVFAFNEGLDKYVLKPVATGYANVVPQPVRRGVDNFFANAADAWSAVNDILQGKGQAAFEDVVRVTTNSFFGIGGIFDVASEMGIERHKEDFGQTLGRWGFAPGPYIVWPLLGPSTLRDSVGLPLDLYAGSPGWAIHDTGWQWGVGTLHLINSRSNLLSAGDLLNDISLDKYTFVRDAYLQRRRSLVNDGEDPSGGSKQDDDNDSGYAPMSTTPAAPPAAASAPAK